MKLPAIIILYNPVKEMIDNIKSYSSFFSMVYIIDNSEPDYYLPFHEISVIQNMKYLKNKANLGIACALNQGAELAISEGHKWVFTFDQDSKPTEEMVILLSSFITKIESQNTGIISPYHELLYSNKVAEMPEYEEKIEVMTSGNLLNLEVYKQVGPFMNDLFIDSVDHEYCLRLQKNGYKVIQFNTAILEHNLGDGTEHFFIRPLNLFKKNKKLLSKKIVNNHNYIRKYYIVRNRLYVSNEYKHDFPNYREIMLKSIVGEFSNVIFYEKDKIRKLKSMIAGIFDYKRKKLGKKSF